MRELSYLRSLLPEISFPRVETVIDDEVLHDVLKDDRYISCPNIPIRYLVEVLKSYNLVYDKIYYYGTYLFVHIYFKHLPISLASCVVEQLRSELESISFIVTFPQVSSYESDKVVFNFSISYKYES